MRLLALALLLGACRPAIDFAPDAGRWAAPSVPGWTGAARVAVTNNGDDTLSFVSLDLAQPALLGVFPVGDDPIVREGPHTLAASPDGRWLWVPLSRYVPGAGTGPHGTIGLGTEPASVLQIDAATGVKRAELTIEPNAGDLVSTRDGATLYVSHFDLNRLMAQISGHQPAAAGYSSVAVVDTATLAKPALYPVCPTAHGMALSSDERSLYITCSASDELAIFDVGTHAVSRVPVGPSAGTPPASVYFPYAAAVAGDGSVWVSCNMSGEVRVYDPKAGRMDEARALSVGGVPMFGAFRADGRTLLLPHQGDDAVSVIDTSTSTETAVVPLPNAACLNAHAVVVSADDSAAWVVCEGDHVRHPGTVVALSLAGRPSVTGYVEVGLYTDGITLAPPAARGD